MSPVISNNSARWNMLHSFNNDALDSVLFGTYFPMLLLMRINQLQQLAAFPWLRLIYRLMRGKGEKVKSNQTEVSLYNNQL